MIVNNVKLKGSRIIWRQAYGHGCENYLDWISWEKQQQQQQHNNNNNNNNTKPKTKTNMEVPIH